MECGEEYIETIQGQQILNTRVIDTDYSWSVDSIYHEMDEF